MDTEDDHLSAWDRDFRLRGNLYGGVSFPLPNLASGSRILDVGCGNGKSLAAMGKKGWTVTAFDYSERAVRLCEQQCHNYSGIEFVRGDARRLSFRCNTFDVVFATHVAGHLLSEERVMLADEVTRVTRPGGTVYFRDFGTGDFRCGSGERVEDQTFRRGAGAVTHYFTAEEISGLFSKFRSQSVSLEHWSMRIRGRTYQREEIIGEFGKV